MFALSFAISLLSCRPTQFAWHLDTETTRGFLCPSSSRVCVAEGILTQAFQFSFSIFFLTDDKDCKEQKDRSDKDSATAKRLLWTKKHLPVEPVDYLQGRKWWVHLRLETQSNWLPLSCKLPRGAKTFFLPRAMCIFITSFMGHTKLSTSTLAWFIECWVPPAAALAGLDQMISKGFYGPWGHGAAHPYHDPKYTLLFSLLF